ncbi:hypothetical protein YC2023_026777 [Brassica napus]
MVSSFFPFSSSPVFRRRGGDARDLVTAGSGGGSLLRIYRVVLVQLRWWEASFESDVIVVKVFDFVSSCVCCWLLICGQEKFFGSQTLRCLGGSRESLAVFESASRPCSHPSATVFLSLRFHRRLKRVLARFGMRFKASCGVSYIPALVAFARPCYSGDVKGTPGILGNEENLTFPRVTSMVESGYRCRRISKNKLAECAGFSGWAKLVL